MSTNENSANDASPDSSNRDSSTDSVETIRSIYRIVLGATVSFLPFVLIILVQDAKVDLLPAISLWIFAYWVMIGELWNIEDLTYHYPRESKACGLVSMVYLVLLTMIPVAIILGLDSSNILGKYHSMQPCMLIFAILAAVDFLLQYIYRRNTTKRLDRAFFAINMIFDVVLIILYVVFAIFVLPKTSVFWGAITLFLLYLLEFLSNWVFIPWAFKEPFED